MTPASNPPESGFSIRTFQFRELAQCYFPLNTPDSASKAFRRLIRTYKGLPELLAEKGFITGGRIMAPSVVGSARKASWRAIKCRLLRDHLRQYRTIHSNT